MQATRSDPAPWAALDEEEESVGEEDMQGVAETALLSSAAALEEWKLESHDDDVEVVVEDDEFLEDEVPEPR